MPETKVPSCGQWRLAREIGRGAYGVVYLATGPGGERSAVKVCRRDDIGDERYRRELRGAKLYNAIPPQDELVRMREFAEEPWGFYAVMDLADDEFGRALPAEESYRPKTLASVIDGEKALPLGECVKLGIALSKGLETLQRHHLLHRDIKPGNVLYFGGRPALSDPGLVVEESEAASIVGTPAYDPPEGFTGAASDVYSLGLTLKAASFGRRIEDLDKGPAFEADTGAKLFPVWWRILNKATDPTPSRRYQSAKALTKDLDRLRLRMVLPSTGLIKVAVVAVALAAALYYAISAKNKIDKREAQEKSVVEETMQSMKWAGVTVKPTGLAETYSSNHRWKIDAIAATNAIQAAELESLLDKMVKLGKRDEELMKQIEKMDDEATRKRENGKSDNEEFQRAKELDNEREKVYAEIVSINKELSARLK